MTIDESLFDEFGNYLGREEDAVVEEEGSVVDASEESDIEEPFLEDDLADDADIRYRQQIVLHEDKKYYLSAEEVYGPGVETLVQDEDTQPLSEPIIESVKVKNFQLETTITKAKPTFDFEYLASLMETPERIRNVAFCGHLHHGKSSLIDVLVTSCHEGITAPDERRMPRYSDSFLLEQDREVSLKAKLFTLLLPTLSGTSMVCNLLDTPGHVDFDDEVTTALRTVDGVVIVVDVVEGLMCQTEAALKNAIHSGLPMVLIINKIERLFLELKLPPTDAYYKLKHVIEEINTFMINTLQVSVDGIFAPELGNVLFASTMTGWMFSLQSYASIYLQKACPSLKITTTDKYHHEEFAKRLWGDVYYHKDSGKFLRTPVEGATKRTFISFILEPLYKIYGAVLSEEGEELKDTLLSIGIKLRDKELVMNTKAVLRKTMGILFGNSTHAFTSCISDHLSSPSRAAFNNVAHNFDGPLDSLISKSIQACSADTEKFPTVAFVSKAYPKATATEFDALVRVHSGRLVVGQQVKVMQLEGSRESTSTTISGLFVACGRYKVPIASAPAGSIVLVSGIDGYLTKTATILDHRLASEDCFGMKGLSFSNKPLLSVAIEPVIPSELPKMLDGLRKINKTYPLLQTKVEDSGEHVLMGTGELYMDCALHDLRRLYADIEIKVSDPVAKFAETIAEMSYIKCFAETPNGKNQITIIAEPLEKNLIDALETGRLPNPRMGAESAKELGRILQKDFGWDILAARSVWAFGPDEFRGTSMILDDTLPLEVDKEALTAVKDLIIQGFQWACREGPLCEEAVRGVKFRIIGATIATDPAFRAAGQLIPTIRRACYSAMLTAAPRLMESVKFVEIQTLNEFVEAVYAVLAKRRGHVTHDAPKAGTPLYIIRAYIPLMDSFGFETDLRIHTQGMTFCQSRHDHWQIVSGDPLDSTIKLIPLEPSPAPQLARDYLLKTRRRKGLSEDVKISKFFDETMLIELAREEAISGIKGLEVY